VLDEQIAEVQRVLRDIGAGGIPQVLVYNKLDNLDAARQPHELTDVLELEAGVRVPRVFVSALQGRGLVELRRLLASAAAGTLSADLNSMHASSTWDPAVHAVKIAASSAPSGELVDLPAEHHPPQPQ